MFLKMPSIPREYLEIVANQKHLTSFQKEAFIERLANIDLSDLVVAQILNISRERYSSRMTQVYKKFNVPSGNIPGKAKLLFFEVLDMYHRAHPDTASTSQLVDAANDNLVQDVQQSTQELINARCGQIKILDMSRPIEVKDIFTEVKITNQIPSQRRIELSDLVEKIKHRAKKNNPKFNISRLFEEEKISGIELLQNCSKLMILGRPGAGKTTFLKYIATFTNRSEILPGHVPIFVSLKDFQDQENATHLKTHIEDDLSQCNISKEIFERLLKESRVIFLFDGLDEVRKENFNRVIRQIKEISQIFSNNRFIITCRLAANEYKFENFLEVEVCDFTEEQIAIFVGNWFATKKSPKKTKKFINRLKNDQEISELATNPLLLTLLCMVFEESEEFPKNQAELYQEGLDVLLRKWDVSRAVERPETYRKLSKHKKEDLLSKIAYATFEKNEGLFKKETIEKEIRDYILNLPRSINSPKDVELECNSALQSMIAQHGLIVEVAKGIYSFSHRTFHEYFVSLKIVKTLDPQEQKNLLNSLAIHINDYRWQEVFLLVSCMLPQADYLIKLIKEEIDKIVEKSEKIRLFLAWLNEKSAAAKSKKDISNLKAISQVFYFNLIVKEGMISKKRRVSKDFLLDSELMKVLNCCLEMQRSIFKYKNLKSNNRKNSRKSKLERKYTGLISSMDRCISESSDVKLQERLIELQKELPDAIAISNKWWVEDLNQWADSFRDIIFEYRNIGHDWNFTESEFEALKEYYEVNKLLAQCLKGDCYVSREVREEINMSTLLPMDKV